MAVKWSWSFGAENNDDLIEMGWSVYDAGNTTFTTQSSSPIYTYPGSPAGRKSITFSQGVPLGAPPKTLSSEGWVSVSFYCSDLFHEYSTNMHAIKITDGGSGNSIKVYSDVSSAQTMILQVGNNFDASGSVTVSQNDWHTISLQYSVTGATWSARWYLDGAAVGSLTSEITGTPAASGNLPMSIAGCSITNDFFTHYGHIVSYDDWNDEGWKQVYVTRLQPTQDLGAATVGSWTAVGAATSAEAVESPFNTSSYSSNSAASVGDKLGIGAAVSDTIMDQLNILSGSTIYGVTNHAFVTGSGASGSVGIGKVSSPGVISKGDFIFPDTSDVTYGYVTSGSFVTSDRPVMVYEVE